MHAKRLSLVLTHEPDDPRLPTPRTPRTTHELPLVAVPLCAMDDTAKPRVPEKPALEGLETKWQQRWDADATYKFDRTQSRDRDLLDRHARRRRSADRCISGTCSRIRTPMSSRDFSGCAGARCSIPWGGTTTACRPSGACRTITACDAIRRSRTIPASSRRRSRRNSRSRSPGRISSSSASG